MSSGRTNSLRVRTRYSVRPSRSVPPVMLTFSAASRLATWPADSPSAVSLRSSSSTWISSSSPPDTTAAATPSMRSKARLRSSSAMNRSCARSSEPCRPTRMMGSSDGSKRSRIGGSASRGSRTRSRRSRTSRAAKSMSVSHANSRVTSETSARDEDVTRTTLLTTPTAFSIGRVSRDSISTGAVPS